MEEEPGQKEKTEVNTRWAPPLRPQPALGRSRWPRDESRHVPVNKQVSEDSKAKGSKMLHCSLHLPLQTLGAFPHPAPPLLCPLTSASLQVSVGAGGLHIMDFLPGNFLWWKLWGNFLLSRLLPAADKGNCLKPPSRSC